MILSIKRSFDRESPGRIMSSSSSLLGSETLTITPLGAGNEVGRSCIVLRFKGKTVMFDCGVHPAHTGLASLPFFDEIDPATIDLVLITHFHLDHAAALPYFMEKTTFQGKVYMTHPTKAIYKWMLSDFVRVTNVAANSEGSNVSDNSVLYTDEDLSRSFEKISVVDYHQEVDLGGIKFTAYNAGHVLGAAMFLVEIAGVRVLYTGDYSREEDRHLMAAENPPVRPEVMVCESTYGVSSHMPRDERELRFTSLVHDVVARGGRCLIPIFALGRAQELLLILDEYWQAHPELQTIPIFYASNVAKKCMAVYQTFVNMMNDRIKKQIAINNPFMFKFVQNLKSSNSFADNGPCVILASPAMLQSGFSRDLFERWCSNKKNGCIIPGYVVEGTLGYTILTEPEHIESRTGEKLPLRMTIDYISFSAHVDFQQNSEFIDLVHPPHLVLVHGEATGMMRLKAALQHRYEKHANPIAIYTPKNCESVQLPFRVEKSVKLVGLLAEKYQKLKLTGEDAVLEGILVGKDFEYQLVAPQELEQVTGLHRFSIKQKIHVISGATMNLIGFHLEGLFGKENLSWSENTISVYNEKFIVTKDSERYTVEWEGDPMSDIMADSIVSLIAAAECARASVKVSNSGHSHSEEEHHHKHASSVKIIHRYLSELFGELEETTLSDDDDTPCYQFTYMSYCVKVTMEHCQLVPNSDLPEDCMVDLESRLAQVQKIVNPDIIL